MKVNNKLLLKNLILCGAFLITTNINSYAKNINSYINRDLVNENIDITHKSIVRSFSSEDGLSTVFNSVAETQDNSLVAVGFEIRGEDMMTQNMYTDAIMVKYDKYGSQQWAKHFGGSGNDYFCSAIETKDGGVVVTGQSYSVDAGFDNQGFGDAIIVKYDRDGNQQWLNSFGGSSDDAFNSIIETQDGGFITAGESKSADAGFTHKGSDDAIIVKYDRNGNQQWVKIFGGSNYDAFYSVVETQDGGFITAGESKSGDAGFTNKGSDDAIIVKYDSNGDQQWVKSFGGSRKDAFNSVVETKDGGFIAVGESYSTNAGFANNGGCDAIIVKYDSNGNQEWVKSFGGSDDDTFRSVIKVKDRGFVAVGQSDSADAGFANNGGCDAIIVKYDSNGIQQWIKSFGGSQGDYFNSVVETQGGGFVTVGSSMSSDAGFEIKQYQDVAIAVKYDNECKKNENVFNVVNNLNTGLNLDDYFYSAIETKDGGFIAVGYSESTNLGFDNKGFNDAIIVKYDRNGNQQWVKNFGGSSNDYFNSVVETQDGGFIAVGDSSSTNAGFTNKGKDDAVIVKYDRDGNQQWIKSFSGSEWDYFRSIIETKDGGFIAVGDSRSTDAGFTTKGHYDAIIVKYDRDGNQEWVKNFGGSNYDVFHSVVETQDGGFITAGESKSGDAGFTNNGGYDAIIVKYDKDGNQEWVKSFGGSDSDDFTSVVEVQDGGFIAIGSSGSEDIDYDCDTNYPAIIVKYDRNGNQLWAKNWGRYYDEFSSIIETSDKSIVIVGQGVFFGDDGFGYDGVIVKFDGNGNLLWNKSFGESGENSFNSLIETQDGGFIAVGMSNSNDSGFTNNGYDDAIIVKYNKDGNQEWVKSIKVELPNNLDEFTRTREHVNKITDEGVRRYLNEKLDKLDRNFGQLELKTASANLDVYIKSQNMLSLSLDTNSITFENYSGVEDMEMLGAVNISIKSSLPYQLNAYLPVEIQNSDKSKTLPIDILNIRDASESDYKQFANTTDKIVLKDGCTKGNDKVHTIDLKLSSNQAHKADIYKTVIKFEAEQK